MPTQLPPDVRDLAPSCKLVYVVLEGDSPLSRSEIQERTQLPERTLDRALSTLDEEGIIALDRDSEDLREVVAITATM